MGSKHSKDSSISIESLENAMPPPHRPHYKSENDIYSAFPSSRFLSSESVDSLPPTSTKSFIPHSVPPPPPPDKTQSQIGTKKRPWYSFGKKSASTPTQPTTETTVWEKGMSMNLTSHLSPLDLTTTSAEDLNNNNATATTTTETKNLSFSDDTRRGTTTSEYHPSFSDDRRGTTTTTGNKNASFAYDDRRGTTTSEYQSPSFNEDRRGTTTSEYQNRSFNDRRGTTGTLAEQTSDNLSSDLSLDFPPPLSAAAQKFMEYNEPRPPPPQPRPQPTRYSNANPNLDPRAMFHHSEQVFSVSTISKRPENAKPSGPPKVAAKKPPSTSTAAKPGRKSDTYNPRLKTYAPPVYIDLGSSSGSCGRTGGAGGRQCATPTDRLKHVDIIEELCYYTPGEPQPAQAYDYYNWCEETGELEFVSEGPCCPPEPQSNPVTYSKKQRFHFNPIDPGRDEDDDGPPFTWAGDSNNNNNCNCKCCRGARGRDPGCKCTCCCSGRARRANPHDEVPVGGAAKNRDPNGNDEDVFSAGDLDRRQSEEEEQRPGRDRCADLVPKQSGIYYFDAQQRRFVPHEPEPEILIEESYPPPPPPCRKPAAQPCEDLATLLQPIMQPMMNPCFGMGMGGMGMNGMMGMGGMGGMNGMMGMGGMGGMNGMMGMGGCGGMGGMNGMMGMGGCGGMGGMGMGGCCPPGCTLPIVMMPNCQQQQQAPPPREKKKKKKKKKETPPDTVIDFETEPSYEATSYGYGSTPEVVTVRSPPLLIVPESSTLSPVPTAEPTPVSPVTFVATSVSVVHSHSHSPISTAAARVEEYEPTTEDERPITVITEEEPDETDVTIFVPPGIEGDIDIAPPEWDGVIDDIDVRVQPLNPQASVNVDGPDVTVTALTTVQQTGYDPTQQNAGLVDVTYRADLTTGEDEDEDEEEEDFKVLTGSKTFQFQPQEQNALPPATA